ncbi:hypothetical protein XBP1_2630028 [Xenorhabdus bovienii str. puntauvense]|uniref:Uncharacterized protein n=1 Tax=Xenorhabdus bovienii str. puntauvense TaxID=1398201 RepID=A0A077NGD1_XENBV|nr:hypothetical protein XBFFR1_2570025 [Xenorhabdus bovienii str. feltiae France]CDG93739.1 hypothetical protein XBFFL1_2670026 [Xenorhabdus bovienii str. feltiae Florida]CDG97438.1 hypothetical protein XBP1_2630028 [Xenorhabdus bovienii str. puntauvense]
MALRLNSMKKPVKLLMCFDIDLLVVGAMLDAMPMINIRDFLFSYP